MNTKKHLNVLDITYIGLFAALMAICSWISIPMTVPFTPQTMGVFLALGLLGGKRGTLSVLVYILLGVVGLPVFAGFSGGINVLLGNTGGYIVGFLLSALVIWAITHFFGTGTPVMIISMVIGLIVCYAFGTAWFMLVYMRASGSIGLATVLSWCVTPFIIPDLVKIALAIVITKTLKRYVHD